MSANHGQLHAPGHLAKQRSLLAEVAMREGQQSFVRKGRSYERNPKWQDVRTEAGGSGNGGEVHQVYKICVVAEIRVQLHRIRGYLVVSINSSGGGQDEQVHGGPLFGGRPAQIHEAIFSLE